MTAFGHPHLHLRLTGSTNERARALAEAGAPSGTIVTAGEQSAGRGRRGRVWSAPAGKALLYSAILRPLDREHALLPLSVPVAVCEAIESIAPVECAIKWPNDVWIDERKVAGVLIEARPPDWAVIGVGVNVAIEAGEFPRLAALAGDLGWERSRGIRPPRRGQRGARTPRRGRRRDGARRVPPPRRADPAARSAGRAPGSSPAAAEGRGSTSAAT